MPDRATLQTPHSLLGHCTQVSNNPPAASTPQSNMLDPLLRWALTYTGRVFWCKRPTAERGRSTHPNLNPSHTPYPRSPTITPSHAHIPPSLLHMLTSHPHFFTCSHFPSLSHPNSFTHTPPSLLHMLTPHPHCWGSLLSSQSTKSSALREVTLPVFIAHCPSMLPTVLQGAVHSKPRPPDGPHPLEPHALQPHPLAGAPPTS